MPKKTFDNLPLDKKEKIVTAIKEEFSRHPYGEVSINRIVKKADISRGSIYQYFDGKEDMLFFILKEYCSYFITMIKESLAEKDGDIYATIELALDKIFHKEDERLDKKAYRVLFSDSRVAELITGVSRECKGCITGDIMVVAAVRPYLNLSDLDLKTKQEEDIFLEILVDSLCKPVVQYLNDGVNRYDECMGKVNLLWEHFKQH